MPATSSHNVLNDRLQDVIVRGEREPLLALLNHPDHQRLIEQSCGPTPFLPGLRLRLTVNMLQAMAEVGPWAGKDLADLLLAMRPSIPENTPLIRVVGEFDDLTPSSVRDGMARTLIPKLLPYQDVHARDDEGLTALERAARVHLDTAFDLLLPQTDLTRLRHQAIGLLREATQYGSLAMVQRLLPLVGDEINTPDAEQNTLLHLALLREDKLGERGAILDALIPCLKQATCWAVNDRDDTPLRRAVRNQDQASVERIMAVFRLTPYRAPMEVLRPAEAAVNNQWWEGVGAMLSTLPESIARTWLSGQHPKLLNAGARNMLDGLDRHWEGVQLRQALDDEQATGLSNPPDERPRSRL